MWYILMVFETIKNKSIDRVTMNPNTWKTKKLKINLKHNTENIQILHNYWKKREEEWRKYLRFERIGSGKIIIEFLQQMVSRDL